MSILVIQMPLGLIYRYKAEQRFGDKHPPENFMRGLKYAMRSTGFLILLAWLYLTFLLADFRFGWYGRVCCGDFLEKDEDNKASDSQKQTYELVRGIILLVWTIVHMVILFCGLCLGLVGGPAYMIGFRQGKIDQKIEDLES